MNAQLLLKLFALASIAATAAAIAIWRQTGTAPPSWLLKVSLATFVAAMLTGLAGAETRPRLMLRFLAALSALVSAIALISDMTGGKSGFTSLLAHLSDFVPSLVSSANARVTALFGPAAWDPIATTVLSIPTFATFAALAVALGFASRSRQKLRIFVN